jgi:rhodanese-related sulfurtransferase
MQESNFTSLPKPQMNRKKSGQRRVSMKRKVVTLCLTLAALFFVPHAALAANYVKTDILKQWLASNKQIVIVDIQTADDFGAHHFKGSIETNAFPAKSDEEKMRLDKILPRIRSSKGEVVIICPMGKGGALNAYDYLKSKGVPENRLLILEGGIAGWPYPDLFVKGR